MLLHNIHWSLGVEADGESGSKAEVAERDETVASALTAGMSGRICHNLEEN